MMPVGIVLGKGDALAFDGVADDGGRPVRRERQAAEYFARRESGWLGFEDLAPTGNAETSGDVTAVVFEARADGSKHHVEYTRVASTWRQRLTCQTGEESAVPQYRLVRYSMYR